MSNKEKIKKIDELCDMMNAFTLKDLREEKVMIAITKLRVLLTDLFGIIKVRKT